MVKSKTQEMKANDIRRIIQSLDDSLSEVRFIMMRYGESDLLNKANDSLVDVMEALKTEILNIKENNL